MLQSVALLCIFYRTTI